MKKSPFACAALLALSLPAAAAPIGSPPATTTTTTADDGFAFAAGMKGLSFALPSSGAPTFGFTWFVSPTGAIRLDVGLDLQLANAQPTGGSDFAFSVEASYRAYLARFGRLYPFLQPGIFFNRVGGADPSGSLALAGSVGVEYFLLDHFSIAADTGLIFAVANIGGVGPASASFVTNTSALFANFYF